MSDQSIKKLRSEVSGVSSKQANTSDYEREVSLASIEYVNAQDKYTAAKNKSLVIGSSIRQILEGQPSYQPEPTQAPLWLGMIGGGSFLLTLIGILLVKLCRSDDTCIFKTREVDWSEEHWISEFVEEQGFQYAGDL